MFRIHKYARHALMTVLLLAITAIHASAEDPYDKLAKELCNVTVSTGQAKVAILPFSYLDKRKSDGGVIVSERLTTRVVKLRKFLVIERELLENILSEQHLEASGTVSAETAKKIGRILGVEAVINGTLLDVEDGMVEVNARVIKTDTAEVVASGSVEVKKIWSDVATNQPPQPAQQIQPEQQAQPAEQAPVEQPYRKREIKYYNPGVKLDTFLEIFQMSGDGQMTLEFKNSSRGLTQSELYFYGFSNSNKSYHFDSLSSAGNGNPLGLRIVGFGKNFGFAWEVSSFDQQVKYQDTTVSVNGKAATPFAMHLTDYLKVSSFNFLDLDILFRFADKWFQPFIGAGFGMSFNTVSSPYVQMTDGTALSQFEPGLMLHFPIYGVRFVVGNNVSLFYEMRTVRNNVWFDRDVVNESDYVYTKIDQTLMGIGYKF